MVADASFGQVTMSMTGREPGAQACATARVARGGSASQPAPAPAPAGMIGKAWSSPPAETSPGEPARR
jgi:hypothetical protein